MSTLEELKTRALDLRERRLFAEAAEAAHLYLQQRPHSHDMLLVLADTSLMAGYIEEADKILTLIHAARPTGYTWTARARVASARGDTEEAERLAREALRLNPDYAPAWQEIGAVRKFRPGDPIIAKAQRFLRKKNLEPLLERTICYALCKAMNDIGKWDKAWDYATRGAAIDRRPYDPAGMTKKLVDQRQTFDGEFLAKKDGRGHSSDAPIFVVGMPRSGTTLVEAILAATGQITPMGELRLIPQIAGQARRQHLVSSGVQDHYMWTRTWRDEAFAEVAEYYLADCKRRNNGVAPDRFVDKLPGNALHLGEIALMFPNAYIIHLDRDPLDTCVSCYLGRFGDGHHYATRPEWLGHAANIFKASAEEMGPLLPNRMLTVCYEDLVSDPEPQIRRMLEFLGADWNPNCLTPGRDGHTSTTRSKVQIRQPISPRSVGRWKRYKNRIAPLAEALGIPEEEWRARCAEDTPRQAA